jgi:hypothetical protein
MEFFLLYLWLTGFCLELNYFKAVEGQELSAWDILSIKFVRAVMLNRCAAAH